jgi:6-phosphogluconate dehydrogenase
MKNMQIGIVGLGRMGYNMALRLVADKQPPVVFDVKPDPVQILTGQGAVGAATLKDMAALLHPPRVVWIMVPAGEPVQSSIDQIHPYLESGDIIIDGGNSNYKDSIRRAETLKVDGIHYLDVGVSGGVWGLEYGYNLMIGGPTEAFTVVEPIFRALAGPEGYAHVGSSGAGHYAKMVHNGIEYGIMQAYGEGLEVLYKAPFGFDLKQLCHLWNEGSVVRSWLLELAERAFDKEGNDLGAIRGWVPDSGEGRWTVQEAIDLDVPAPVLTLSLMTRLASRQDDSFSARVVAALRSEFGGHAVKKAEE